MCATACRWGSIPGAREAVARRVVAARSRGRWRPRAAATFSIWESFARAALMVPPPSAAAPAAPRPFPNRARETADAVYFPSCVTRVLRLAARTRAQAPLARAVVDVASRAGIGSSSEGCRGICCGMPYASKGFEEAHAIARIVRSSARGMGDAGRLAVVVDTSPCAWSLSTCRDSPHAPTDLFDALRIEDSVWGHRHPAPAPSDPRRVERIAAHPVCSL